MATALSVTLTFKLSHDYTNALDLSTPKDDFDLTLSDTLSNGTGNDQVDVVWHDQRTLATTSENLDLAGSLTSSFGTTVTFAKVKAFCIKNTATTTNQIVTVGGAGATQFVNWVGAVTDTVKIGPAAILLLWSPMDGYAVGAGASDLLKIATNASITYDIWIIGTSA